MKRRGKGATHPFYRYRLAKFLGLDRKLTIEDRLPQRVGYEPPPVEYLELHNCGRWRLITTDLGAPQESPDRSQRGMIKLPEALLRRDPN